MKQKLLSLILIGTLVCILIFLSNMPLREQHTQESEANLLARKEEIIKQLEENYEAFEKVAKFITKKSPGFYLFKLPDDSLIGDSDGNLLDISQFEICEELKLIVYSLNYPGIMDFGDEVNFFAAAADSPERGLSYIKDGTIPEENNQMPYTLIKDNWYYYERNVN